MSSSFLADRRLALGLALAAGAVVFYFMTRQHQKSASPVVATEATPRPVPVTVAQPSAPQPQPQLPPSQPPPPPPSRLPSEPKLSDEASLPSSQEQPPPAPKKATPNSASQPPELDTSKAAKSEVTAAEPAPDATLAKSRTERLVPLLDELKDTMAGSETRRVLVQELHEILEQASALKPKEQRKVARVFADGDGPEICYEIESCMRGDWVRDAKNGTMSAISKISRLPGPIGQTFFAYRGMREKLKVDAAHGVCSDAEHRQRQGAPELITAPQPRSAN